MVLVPHLPYCSLKCRSENYSNKKASGRKHPQFHQHTQASEFQKARTPTFWLTRIISALCRQACQHHLWFFFIVNIYIIRQRYRCCSRRTNLRQHRNSSHLPLVPRLPYPCACWHPAERRVRHTKSRYWPRSTKKYPTTTKARLRRKSPPWQSKPFSAESECLWMDMQVWRNGKETYDINESGICMFDVQERAKNQMACLCFLFADLPPIAKDPDCDARMTHIHASAKRPIPIIAEGEINRVNKKRTPVKSK